MNLILNELVILTNEKLFGLLELVAVNSCFLSHGLFQHAVNSKKFLYLQIKLKKC